MHSIFRDEWKRKLKYWGEGDSSDQSIVPAPADRLYKCCFQQLDRIAKRQLCLYSKVNIKAYSKVKNKMDFSLFGDLNYLLNCFQLLVWIIENWMNIFSVQEQSNQVFHLKK